MSDVRYGPTGHPIDPSECLNALGERCTPIDCVVDHVGKPALMGAIDRRQVAERHALDLLAVAGDPVATAIKGAVREATTVEITPALVASFSHTWWQEQADSGESQVQQMLRIAYQAAGFEVIL